MIDETHSATRRSWVASAHQHLDFPIQNLPLGVFAPSSGTARGGVAIGDGIFDLAAALELGLFEGLAARAAEAASGATLNPLLALGREARVALRRRLGEILDAECPERAQIEALSSRLIHRADDCRLELPASIGDYTDFFAGIHHATNAGKLFRPDNPLLPNYKYVPIGYHGRASSITVSEATLRRPNGQRKGATETIPSFGPSRSLDYELELGVWIGPGNELGTPIAVADAANHIAGFCLLNDWSARDIQGWEYQPLGPFLGKSFCTTISPWVVTPEALAPFRTAQATRPAGGSSSSALSLRRSGPGHGRPQHRARGIFAHTGSAIERAPPTAPVGRQRAPPVLDRRTARGPSQQRGLQPASGRSVRDRYDLGARRRRPRQLARNLGRGPAAGRARIRRNAPLPRGRRHRHHARSLPARRLCKHRLGRMPRNDCSGPLTPSRVWGPTCGCRADVIKAKHTAFKGLLRAQVSVRCSPHAFRKFQPHTFRPVGRCCPGFELSTPGRPY
jgi:2-keto-4-pentenoate hydratase/2-oxohepta-3-ene-1,7-dioic acid hydratase in catechol pathway